MKSLLVLFLMIASSVCFSADDWKVIAESENCADDVKVLAKPGERYVIVSNGAEQEKLFSKDGEAYKAEGMEGKEYKSANYTYTHPSMVEANPPKLAVTGKKPCRMGLK